MKTVLSEHCLTVTHALREISCAIFVHVNMACCVRHKQQTSDDGFLVLLLFQKSKITLYSGVFLLACITVVGQTNASPTTLPAQLTNDVCKQTL